MLIFLVLSGTFFYFLLFKDKTKKDIAGIGWDNPEEVFNIQIPAGFNEYQIQRAEGKKTEARKLYNTKKEDTWTWIVIGNMYKFVEDYDRAIELKEDYADAYYSRGISRINLNDYSRGCDDLIRAKGLGYAAAEKHINMYCKRYL